MGADVNLFCYLNKQRRFSRATFPDATWQSALAHRELEEQEVYVSHGKDVTEWADCIILDLDAAMRAGHEPHAICAALEQKLEININRKWGQPDARGVVEHVRE